MSLSDPHPGYARVMSIFHGPSGDPSDVFVTNFTFRMDGGSQTVEGLAPALRDVLDAFWYAEYPNEADDPNTLASFLSPAIVSHTYRMYDLADAIPRPPRIIEPSLTAPIGENQRPLPRELAVVLSTRTALRGPRGRGRHFVGPFALNALSDDAATGEGTVHANLRRVLANAADNVLETSQDVTWVMYSPTDDVFREVTGGYVDSEWDHMQSRAPGGSVRAAFGAYTPGS